MPVRSAAQCRPVGRVSHSSAVWITDSMLRQAIEHYHRQFPPAASCRRLSSHSGPLESRRRQLGKRSMTGIMPSSSTYPPLWHFDIAWVPSEWKWEPPSTMEERKRKKQAINPSALFDGLISWLEKSDADKPFIQPPSADIAFSSISSGGATAAEYTYDNVSIPTKLPQELAVLRDRILLLETVDDGALEKLRKLFRRDYCLRMETASLSVEELRLSMEPLDQILRDKISDPRMADGFVARIRRTVLTGLGVAQKRNPDNVAVLDLWMAFANIVSTTGGDYQNIRLFKRMMSLMPAWVRSQIPMDQISTLAQCFVMAQASSGNLPKRWTATAAQFGEALSMLSPAQIQTLDTDMAALFSQQEQDLETSRKLRFSWLMAKAYNPTTTNEAFTQSYRDLIMSHGIDPRHIQLWQIIVGRLRSAGTISDDAHSELTQTQYSSLSKRWVALFSTIHGLPNASSILTQLYSFFKDVNQTDALIHAVSSLPLSRISIDSARTIATSCDDHRLALQLYEALRLRLGQESHITTWGWEAWAPYVERIIKDAEITRPVHWQAMDLTRLATAPTAAPEEIAREIQAKMALVDRMGQWYLEAAHLNDRQKLRRLQRCASVQRSLTRAVSPLVLARVADVVTRDLQRGEWGRTTWLQWLLGMVAQMHGDEHASEVSKTLDGWRWMVERHKAP
ncbi:uncharacterized protein Triagg1_433 [Trichoderma aggressivum f. europaeum]|uniref:Fungal specific transcription factor domain containing protein n=1 Tax=Trichoderma aggressivum f. europaeum TaxID=173218 RepID=A0AAE1ILC7_9HYPO|nr:hypothetical protein Triagg1_433 [Trichoderma aggressivum f. europaeum]